MELDRPEHLIRQFYMRRMRQLIPRWRRRYTLVEIAVRQDWRDWWLVTLIIFSAFCVVLGVLYHKGFFSLAEFGKLEAYGVTGFVVFVTTWYWYRNSFLAYRPIWLGGLISKFIYLDYFNFSSVDISNRRKDYFFGSGYNSIERVVVLNEYVSFLMLKIALGYNASKVTFRNCLSMLGTEFEDDILTLTNLHQVNRVKRLMNNSAWYISQSMELTGQYTAARTSLLTTNGLSDVDFQQRGEPVASGLRKWSGFIAPLSQR